MRIYRRRGGGLGASVGPLGLLIVAPFYIVKMMIVCVLAIPLIAIFLVSLIAAIGDGLLRVVPAYRRYQREKGPGIWYRESLRYSAATIGNLLNWFGGNRQRYSTRPKTITRRPTAKKPTSAKPVATAPPQAAPPLTGAEAVRAKKRQVAFDAFAELTPIAFAEALRELFSARGFGNVTVVPGSTADSYALTMFEPGPSTTVLLCVPSGGVAVVGVETLRDSIPLIKTYGATKLAIASMKPFTAQAKTFARGQLARGQYIKKVNRSTHRIVLFDTEALINMAEEAGWLMTTEGAQAA